MAGDGSPYSVHVLSDGYSKLNADGTVMSANCTCTLIKGMHNIVVDTMTPWDSGVILEGLKRQGLTCDDISYVVNTHGHSDHTGCNYLFSKANLFCGTCMSFRDQYYTKPFQSADRYQIDDYVELLATPGHTDVDVSVVVQTKEQGVVVVAGDLFEREEDWEMPELWRDVAWSQDAVKQERNRNKVVVMADVIVPGHGPKFAVTEQMKSKARDELEKNK